MRNFLTFILTADSALQMLMDRDLDLTPGPGCAGHLATLHFPVMTEKAAFGLAAAAAALCSVWPCLSGGVVRGGSLLVLLFFCSAVAVMEL